MSEVKEPKKKKKLAPLICRILGTLMLASVIAIMAVLAVPQFMGYETYNIISGSMAPSIPVGSLIIVEPMEPADLEKGDVIAFRTEGSVIAHRVTSNNVIEGTLNTKGDANEEEDLTPIHYANVIGKVIRSFDNLGDVMSYLTRPAGKAYLMMVIACGVMFHMLAGRLAE